MAEPTPAAYRRLPGRTAWFRFGGTNSPSCSLWLGPDHLLKVERSATRETYKRFFYRDIQSILLEKSSRLRTLATFNGIALVLMLILAALINRFSLNGAIFCGVCALPFAIGIAVNFVLGPTCETVLVTAVGTERLSSLGRIARAVPTIQQVTAEVEKTQGTMNFAQFALRWPVPLAMPPVN